MFTTKAARAGLMALMLGMAAVGFTWGAGPADATTFTDNWQCGDSPADTYHVAFNPVTGQPVRVSVRKWVFPFPFMPFAGWACVDTGGYGQHSIGAYGWLTGGSVPNYLQVVSVCPGVDSQGCTGAFAGYTLEPPEAGAVGERVCVINGVNNPCVSAGVTPSGSAPGPILRVTEPPGYCIAKAGGTCATKDVTVGVGGSAGTAYVGATPVEVGAPSACIGVRNDLNQPVAPTGC